MKTIKGWLIDIFAFQKAIEPVVEAPKYPCPVRGCTEPPRIIAQDEQVTMVHCDVYDCYTTYDTTPREAKAQNIIRIQDSWHQHGTRGRQK